MDPNLLTPLLTGEAARLLRVSPETVRLWTRHGRLPAMTTSNGVRILNRADVVALAEQRAREGQSQEQRRGR